MHHPEPTTLRIRSWMRYFACIAVLILGMATFALWVISSHREAQQSRLARDARTLANVESIAKDLSHAVSLGLPLDRLVGVEAYLEEKRTANRLGWLRLLDDRHHVIASAMGDRASGVSDVSIAVPIHDASGRSIGFVSTAPLAGSGVGMPAIAVLTMFIAAASAAAFAGEGLAYAWQLGPLLRRRVLARAVTCLAGEDYRYAFLGAQPRRWDRRSQRIVRHVRQMNERYAQLQRLAQSLLQTQVAAARTQAILTLQKEASEHAWFATSGVIHRHVVAVQAQARWLCVTIGTAVGGLVQLMYLSAARQNIFAEVFGKIADVSQRDSPALLSRKGSVYAGFDGATWFDWRGLWHPVWQTAGAIDDPFRALCLYTCLFGGIALAGRQPPGFRILFFGHTSQRSSISRRCGPVLCPALWPATLCCVFVAILSLSWQSAIFDWRMACLYGALGGFASGVLLRACSGAIHIARRAPGYDNALAPVDDAWLGMFLGLCWFGPLIVEVLFVSISPAWIALLLCAFALSAGAMLLSRAGANSPWRQSVKRRRWRLSHGSKPQSQPQPQPQPQNKKTARLCVRRHSPTLRVSANRIGAVGTGCVIAAIALSSHLQMLVAPVRPGGFAPMLLKWAALGMGLLCGAAFSRSRTTHASPSVSMKRRVAAGVAAVGAAVLGISSLAASGMFPGATRWLSDVGVVVVSMSAVIALAAGVWSMLALSGEAPSKNLFTAALTLLVLCIALCSSSTCVFFVTQAGWSWLRPVAESMISLSTSGSRVTAATCLWWLACAVLMLAALGRHRDAA